MQKIAAKLVKVMQEVKSVKKNGINAFHHYKYVTAADVLEKVQTALTKYDLVSFVLPELIAMEEVKTVKGNIERLATVKLQIRLLDVESGESVTLTGLGSGQDSGDKAVMKAQTAALKYAYMMSLAIGSGDDPEAMEEEAAEGVKPIEQKKPNAEKSGCVSCGTELTGAMRKISMQKYGKALCVKCQKKLGKVAFIS